MNKKISYTILVLVFFGAALVVIGTPAASFGWMEVRTFLTVVRIGIGAIFAAFLLLAVWIGGLYIMKKS